MPTKYSDRLKLPVEGSYEIKFHTSIGLAIAAGYERIVFNGKVPYIEFAESSLNRNNIYVPDSQKWRIKNLSSPYVEYRSRDYCKIKIILWKQNNDKFNEGMFYISPFDLKSDQIPVLIEPLYRKKTLQSHLSFNF